MRRIVLSAAVLATLWGCSGGGGAPPQGKPEAEVGKSDFAALESEVFSPKCVHPGCHGGDSPAGGLDLSKGAAHADLVGVAAHRRPDRLLVKAGDPDASYLVQRLVPGGDTPVMPLGGQALSRAEVERIRAWIRAGAKR